MSSSSLNPSVVVSAPAPIAPAAPVVPVAPSAAPATPNEITKKMKEAADQYAGDQSAEAREKQQSAMALFWAWIARVIHRIAVALGLRNATVQSPTAAQLTGDEKTEVRMEVPPGPEGAEQPAMTPALAEEVAAQEATRILAHITNNPVPPETFTDPALAEDMIRFHASHLGKCHAVFSEQADEAAAELKEHLTAVAKAMDTTPEVVHAQVLADAGKGLIDKGGEIKALIDRLREARLGLGRVQIASKALYEATGVMTAVPGLKDTARAIFAEHLPGLDLDREAPPPKSVTQASGATAAVGTVEAKSMNAAVSDKGDGEIPDTESFSARHGISAKTTIESGPLEGSAFRGKPQASAPVLSLVSAAPLTDDDRAEVAASSFAEKPTSWGDVMAASEALRQRIGDIDA